MSSTELIGERARQPEAVVDRVLARRAGRALLLAGAFGLLVQLLFVESMVGINYPITIAVLLGAGWLARDPSRPRPRLEDVWLAPAAIGLALFVAVRGDSTLLALDVLGSLGLTLLAVASFAGAAVVRRPLERILELTSSVFGWAMVGGLSLMARARFAAPRAGGGLGRAVPVVRGLLIAIPLVLLFAVLFSAADAVFARVTGDLLDWDLDIDELVGRAFVAVVAGWLAAGLLGFITVRDSARDAVDAPLAPGRPRIGATESVIILVALDLLFAVFVVIQAAYLFGGLDTLEASGMTYAEYARRGFFELLVVAFLVAGLVLGLEGFIRQRSRAYVTAAIGLVVLTMVVLASSLLRLRLYQEAYGWTELRFYVLAAIAWFAIGGVATIAALAANRTKWLLHGMFGLSVVFGVGFNLIGPVHFIAEQNVARAIDPSLVPPGGETGLDVPYLASLGTDADIVMAESASSLPRATRREVEQMLGSSAYVLEQEPFVDAWQGWNYSRQTFRALMGE